MRIRRSVTRFFAIPCSGHTCAVVAYFGYTPSMASGMLAFVDVNASGREQKALADAKMPASG